MIEDLNGTMETVRYFGSSRVRIYHNTENESYPLHWHAAIELTMCLDQTYQYIIQGETISLKRGDILWIPAGVLHEISQPNNTGARLIILFNPGILGNFSELNSIFSMLSPFYLVASDNDCYKDIHSTLQTIASQILVIELEGSRFKDTLIAAKIIEFAAHISNAVFEDKIHTNSSEYCTYSMTQSQIIKVYNVCDYIRKHIRDELSLDTLSEKAGLSKYYFSRLFKQFTGMSIVDYINNVRIEEFEKIILNPDVNITDAAYYVGFNSISSFNRVFKKKKGMSPTEYINLVKD
jgi:AraC-like DNA-binding protein